MKLELQTLLAAMWMLGIKTQLPGKSSQSLNSEPSHTCIFKLILFSQARIYLLQATLNLNLNYCAVLSAPLRKQHEVLGQDRENAGLFLVSSCAIC